MKDTLRLTRELKLRDVEFFLIRKGYNGEKVCHMLFLDFKRPSVLQDFPFLIGIEDEEEFGRSNFIKVIIISEAELDTEVKEELHIIASGFLENKMDCHWIIEYEIANIDPRDVGLGQNILPAILPIMKKHNFPYHLTDISNDKFNFLSQE
ncbi:hypothetical protein [Brevibacillus nitrificans]|jgi:hypothetical protein|uniref:hypothetical protein n=1 Tax=Brevibacillus TaxID=55080 RepID=UPI002633D96B|nr:hypothetical protein [Brevibacillus nitrificans]